MASIDSLDYIYKKNIKCYKSACPTCGVDRGFQPRRNVFANCVACSNKAKGPKPQQWKDKMSLKMLGNKNSKNGPRLSPDERLLSKRKASEKAKLRTRERYHNDAAFKLSRVMRARLCLLVRSLKGTKHMSAIDALGCTVKELKLHLESQFQPGMTWQNHGIYGWHVDHIVPLASFDLTNEDSFRKAWHYTNLQPLWAKENLAKGARHA